ncbi:MAG: GDSL-type esterase/lipase family protein [Opitutaceae bacterium]
MHWSLKKIFQASLLLLACCADVHAGDPIRVACVGDSITYGFGIDKRDQQSYPAQLQGLLGDQWLVGNFGKNGATVLKKGHAPYWKAPQFKAAQKFMPDVVIIKLGTNDTRPQNIGKHKSEFVADYVDLIHTFQNLESKPKVWICYSAPIYAEHKGMTNAVLVNDVMPLVTEVARQAGVEVIDLYTALSAREELFPDGIHPNADGAGVIAKTVAPVLEKKSSVSKVAGSKPNILLDHLVLYNLSDDVAEARDVTKENPEYTEALQKFAAETRAELGDWDQQGSDQPASSYPGNLNQPNWMKKRK